jgi:dTDP-4-dehydrorhamnose reductase
LDWFLHSTGEVKGFTNHFWNGLTTLEWVKVAEDMMNNWDTYPTLNQLGTKENKSKYEVLQVAQKVYGKEISIVPFEAPTYMNRCVESDKEMPTLEQQLTELKAFYRK